MIRYLTAIAAAITIAGCASQGVKVTELTDLTAAQRAVIEDAIRLHLKDPELARFSNFKAGSAPEGTTVCGTVNAKNSYGGYTGGATFFGVLRGSVFTDIDIDEVGPKGSRWASNKCAQVGLGSWIF